MAFPKGGIPWNKSQVRKVCKICIRAFYVSPSAAPKRSCCSRKCMALERRLHPTKYWLGKIRSLDTVKKISDVMRGKRKGMPVPWVTGDKSPFWKGGISKAPGYRSMKENERKAKKKGSGGSYSLREWESLKDRYNHTCPACYRNEPVIQLTVDHIVPLSLGGINSIDNIQPLCLSCNSSKNNKVERYAPICL